MGGGFGPLGGAAEYEWLTQGHTGSPLAARYSVVTGADRRALSQLVSQRIHGIVRKPFDPEELASLVVACAEIRSRLNLGTMAIATMIAGSPFLAWLNRLT